MPVQLGDAVDVDQVGGARHPERHDRNEALTAGQNAAVLWAELGQHPDRLIDRSRDVTNERRGLHEPQSCATAMNFLYARQPFTG